jgi:hypothetical protein
VVFSLDPFIDNMVHVTGFEGRIFHIEALKMGPIICAEPSVQKYQSTSHKIPEDHRSHIVISSSFSFTGQF